jgi:hypothetical protein
MKTESTRRHATGLKNTQDQIARSGDVTNQRLSDYPEGNIENADAENLDVEFDNNHPDPKSFSETTDPSKLSNI